MHAPVTTQTVLHQTQHLFFSSSSSSLFSFFYSIIIPLREILLLLTGSSETLISLYIHTQTWPSSLFLSNLCKKISSFVSWFPVLGSFSFFWKIIFIYSMITIMRMSSACFFFQMSCMLHVISPLFHATKFATLRAVCTFKIYGVSKHTNTHRVRLQR